MSYTRGPPPNTEKMVSLKVDNLTYRTRPEELRRAFGKYGEVGDVYIPRDKYNHESRGFAFVRFYDKRDAEDAMDKLDQTIFDGREIRVQFARYGRPTSRFAGRGRYGGRRSYSRSRSPSRSRSRNRSRSKSRSRSRDRRSRSTSKSPRRDRSQSNSPARN